MRKIIVTLLAAALLCALLIGGASFVRTRTAQTPDALRTDLMRAAAYCYAVEGRYPPALDYLTEEYGVRYDKGAFHVFYEPVSSNLAPSITVIEAGEAAA